jgi:hypothetical protein
LSSSMMVFRHAPFTGFQMRHSPACIQSRDQHGA